jgi:hypothetical protein
VKLDGVPAHKLEALVGELADLRHDLGKYVHFEARFVGVDGSPDELRAALRADLLCTRRNGDTHETAWALWTRLRPPILSDDPDVMAIDADIEALRSADLDAPDLDLVQLAKQAKAVAQQCRSLHSRARARREDLNG